MANDLKNNIRENPYQGFTSRPYYSPEGDFLTYFFCDKDHYAHRVDSALTVYLSMEEKKLVGFKIKGVRHIVETLGRFDIFNLIRDVPDGVDTVELRILLLPGIALAFNPEAREHYEEVEKKTRNIRINKKELQHA
jgi:hypothetical protein